MANNIATIGFIADSSQLKTAKTTLDSLVPSARAAEQSSVGLTQSMQQMAQSANAVTAGTSRITAAIQAQEAATVRAVHANGIYVDSAGRVRAAGSAFVNISNQVVSAAHVEAVAIGGTSQALENSVKSYARAVTAQGLFINAAGRVVNAQGRFVSSAQAAAARAELQAMANEQLGQSANLAAQMQQNLNKVLGQGAQDVKIMGLNTANLAAQFQDIGVTAAMGMNPLMIGLQQGTQISAVLAQNGATAASAIQTLATAFRQVVSPLALATIGVVSLVAGLVQLVPWLTLAQNALRGIASGLEYMRGALVFTTQLVAAFAVAWAVVNFSTVIAGVVSLTAVMWRLSMAVYAALAPFIGIPAIITLAVAAIIFFRKEIAKALGADLVKLIKAPFNIIIGLAVGTVRAVIEVFKSIPYGVAVSINQVISGFERMGNRVLEIADKVVRNLPRILGGSKEGVQFRFDPNNDFIAVEKGASDVGKRVSKAFTDSLGADWIGEIGTAAGKAIDFTVGKLRTWADAIAGTDKKYQKLIRSAEKEIALLKVEQQGIGQTSLQYSILREQMELIAKAKEQDITLTPKMIANLKALGTVIGTLKDQNERLQQTFDFARDTVGGFVRDLRDGLKQGEGFLKSFANAALNILNKVSDRLIDLSLDMLFQTKKGGANSGILGGLVNLFSPLFGAGSVGTGSWMPTITPSAKGNVFGRGGLIDKPTLFTFARGGQLGMAGEAGAEAVMPLARGPDGSLGVQVHGAANDNAVPAVVVQVINNAPDTEIRRERSMNSDGSQVERIIIDTTRKAMGSGQFDGVQRARFGNTPSRVVR